MHTLAAIEKRIRDFGKLVDAPDALLPTFGRSDDGARPHVEVDGRGYHFVVVERGQELERITTSDFDELLYRVFDTVTFSLASRYESARRVAMADPRRLMFSRQVELLAKLSPAWAARQAAEHEAILRDHPFDDRSDERATLTAALRADGKSAGDAWRQATHVLPFPETAEHHIYPKYPDLMVYEEGRGRSIEFNSSSNVEPPRVSIPDRDRWAANVPAWAGERRPLIVERLRAAGCVLLEVGETLTTIVSPDQTFRIEVSRDVDEKFGPFESTQILSEPAGTVLLSLFQSAAVDASGFDGTGGVDLMLVGRSHRTLNVRLNLNSGTYQLPPGSAARALGDLPSELEQLARASQPERPASSVSPVPLFRGRNSVLWNVAMTVAGTVLATGGGWMLVRKHTMSDRLAGLVGVVLFGACALTGLVELSRARSRILSLSTGRPRTKLARLAPYVPLIAVLAEAPWIIACALLLFFIVGDQPFHSTASTNLLFKIAVSMPAVFGLFAGVIAISLRLVDTFMRRLCFALGCLLCVCFCVLVGAGWIR